MFISKMEVNYIYIFKYEGKILSEKTNQNRILSILTSEKKNHIIRVLIYSTYRISFIN